MKPFFRVQPDNRPQLEYAPPREYSSQLAPTAPHPSSVAARPRSSSSAALYRGVRRDR